MPASAAARYFFFPAFFFGFASHGPPTGWMVRRCSFSGFAAFVFFAVFLIRATTSSVSTVTAELCFAGRLP